MTYKIKFKDGIEKGYAARAGVSPAIPHPSQGVCPTHNIPFLYKSGVSRKTGQPYGFWGCPAKNMDGTYCKNQPVKTVQQPVAPVQPVLATPVAPIDNEEEVNVDNLPF